MKWMVDLNVVLDVLQQRNPFYRASAKILSKIVMGEASGCLPAHAITTIHYIARRHAGLEAADDAIDWLLANLEVEPQGRGTFIRARSLQLKDFEDAAVASAAEAAGCSQIVTRNVADFAGAAVPAMTPEELLAALGASKSDS